MQTQTDFYEIYDYYSRPLLERTSVQIFLIFCALGFIALIFFFFFKRKSRPIAVWEWALRELDALKPEKCTSKQEFKTFYFQLTRILKKYLDKRFRWQTETKTDDELTGYLEHNNFDPILIEQLNKVLQGASWIKFANEDALKKQAETDLNVVMTVIEQTKPSDKK